MRPVEFEILLSLADGARHGYAILQDMEARSERASGVETGTLYRALQRLAEQDFVRPAMPPRTTMDEDQRRQYYALTPEGRRAAAAEARRMAALVSSARAAKLIPRES